MSDKTTIEWTRGDDGTPGATWNPIIGTQGRWSCVKISPGCANCYSERLNVRFGGPKYVVGADALRLDERVLTLPLSWRKPRRVFVCSMTDLFEERVPDEWIDRIFDVMIEAPHTFQVLTKRPKRMSRWVRQWLSPALTERMLENIWLGTSVESQEYADARIPWLLRTPAVVRFVSCEPMLGPLDLRRWLVGEEKNGLAPGRPVGTCVGWTPPLDWVIAGGESGGPSERALVRRFGLYGPWLPTDEAMGWIRSLRDQCQAAGVSFLHKQWGGPLPKSGGRVLDGKVWHQFPDGSGGIYDCAEARQRNLA
jgi:protein gp37